MLEIRELRKSFGEVAAVDGVSLEIADGEFFSLLGPSGCGKTSLLRMLGGFEEPDAGEIHHDGRRIDRLAGVAARRGQPAWSLIFYALWHSHHVLGLDAGGSVAIHGVGGLTGLCATWILGARRGKYAGVGEAGGMPAAIPGHDIVMVGFGCLLTIAGWLGLNSAGALLFAGVDPAKVVLVGLNTVLSAAFATLAAVFFTRLRFGKPDASLCMNGCVGGLVASSAGCASMAPPAACLTGLVAGALITYSVEFLEVRLRVDDPGGVISMHGLCGIWGGIAVAIFASNAPGQWLAQLAGLATLLGFVLPLSYALLWGLNRVWPMRVPPEAERQGLDLHELGAGAYPEFITHGDEFLAG